MIPKININTKWNISDVKIKGIGSSKNLLDALVGIIQKNTSLIADMLNRFPEQFYDYFSSINSIKYI